MFVSEGANVAVKRQLVCHVALLVKSSEEKWPKVNAPR